MKKISLRTMPEALSPVHGFKHLTSGTWSELLTLHLSVEHNFALTAERKKLYDKGIKE